MKTLSRVAALVLALVWLPAAHAAADQFTEQIAKQESIYKSGEQKVEGYTTDRPLSHYADGLASGFDQALSKLGPNERWLDIGAGEGKAIVDYYSYERTGDEERARRVTKAKAQAIAISIEDRRTPVWKQTAARLEPDRIQYLFGKRFGEYSPKELGRFQLITDVMGGFSYTDNISRFMEKVLGMLEVNGNFYTVLQDIRREDGSNVPFYAGSPFLTEIVDKDGGEMKVCSWLKRITCVQVTCEPRAWEPPTEAFRITKTCEDVSVPALQPTHYQAGTPPERRFQVKN